MSYTMKPKPCKKHQVHPVSIYASCIGCEIERLESSNKQLKEEVEKLRAERGTDIGVKCITESSMKAD